MRLPVKKRKIYLTRLGNNKELQPSEKDKGQSTRAFIIVD